MHDRSLAEKLLTGRVHEEPPRGDFQCLVQAAMEIRDIIAAKLQAPCKNLRDASYFLRKAGAQATYPEVIKQLAALNAASDYVRQSSAEDPFVALSPSPARCP